MAVNEIEKEILPGQHEYLGIYDGHDDSLPSPKYSNDEQSY